MRPLVINYHAFGERTNAEDPHHHFVPVDAFAAQLDLLTARGRQPLDEASFLEGLDAGRWPARSYLITIDDGFASTLDAAEVLARRGVSAVVYVSAGLLGRSTDAWVPDMKPEPLLDAEGVRGLLAAGLAVGVHGWDHQPMPSMDATALRRNTVEARKVLAEVTGELARTFAYPRGEFDAAAMAAVRDAGYEAAFSVARNGGRYAIPRVDVNGTDTLRTFAWKCARWWPAASAVGRHLPTVRRQLHRLVGSAR